MNPESTDKVLGDFALDCVYQVDCIEAMESLPDNCIDVAIADPPYNASKGGRWQWDNSIALPGFGGDWSKVMADWDAMPLGEYFQFTLQWLVQVQRLVKPEGSIWLHGTYHNVGVINFALQMLSIEIINEVIWFKRNSFPNLSGRRLTASHETILWAHTGGAKSRKYRFNYEYSKDSAFSEDQIKQPGKQMRTVWDIPNNKAREELAHGKHPTQKPVRLLTRMLNLSAPPGGVVFAPFAGAGSDCVAAKNLGLAFLGFELEEEYVQVARRRLGLNEPPTPKARPKASAKDSNASEASAAGKPSTAEIGTIPSLIKWTGSKRSQAKSICQLLPSFERYVEPFLGGGAVLFLAGRNGALAGDIYEPLIDLWRLVQTDPGTVIDDYSKQWEQLRNELESIDTKNKSDKHLPKYYYKVRTRFNKDPNPLDLNFLMRTCVNGIVRFNDRGEFNNSFHLSRRGMQPRRFESIVKQWNAAIQEAQFLAVDYQQTISDAKSGDFVYFDPPYAGNKQRYVADLELDDFFQQLERLNSKNVRWALSFDGRRGGKNLTHDVPRSLYKRHVYLHSGNSAVNKVLNGPVEKVEESLYLNY